MTKRVGVVGFGEAGSAISGGLAMSGADVAAFDTRFTGPGEPSLRATALELGVSVVDDLAGLVARSEIVLSLVTSEAALAVAEGLRPHLGTAHIVADLNSTAPSLAREIAGVIEPTGAAFADVAVMAAVPAHQHLVPLLASGSGAKLFAEAGLGMQVTVVGSEAGQASAVKMLRSLVVKGLEALLVEFAVAARRYGAAEQVLESLNGSLPMDSWQELTTYLLTRTSLHGSRRGHELTEVADTLRELGIEPLMAEAGARRLIWAADRGLAARFAERPPQDYDEVVSALEAVQP